MQSPFKPEPLINPAGELEETAIFRMLVVGGGEAAREQIRIIDRPGIHAEIVMIVNPYLQWMNDISRDSENVEIIEKEFEPADLKGMSVVIAASDDPRLNEFVLEEARTQGIITHSVFTEIPGDFYAVSAAPELFPARARGRWSFLLQPNGERSWRRIATLTIIVFALMVVGHMVISALPLPAVQEMIATVKPYFDYTFIFFILAGFLAQMVDGTLGMGYGVTSATCLMSFGVSPVASSAAIHTSEIFTTGISGYSHYRFGNVNKKLFRHLVIPGVIGAVIGAVLLVFLGEKAGKWLMPAVALYAFFLGLKILFKAFQTQGKNKKVKRVGWLAVTGGFFDSFGGGGWGPIVTSNLVSKGRSPRFTIGTVNLTEFFITLSSAITFFITTGVHHWNLVLGLMIGGGIAAPFAAKLAGKLPRKAMMIGVGLMVMVWCIRMF